MRNSNCNSKRTVLCICASVVLWTLVAHAITLPPDVDNAITYLDFNPKTIELEDVAEPGDGNDVPTWAEMAEDTYFMIFIDLSDSMSSNDITAINDAADMFTKYLADEVYEGDLDKASKHVKVTEVKNEHYLQHMAARNQDDPEATRYVNISFTNEADQDYYTESRILYPTDTFTDDLKGNQDTGGLIWGLKHEILGGADWEPDWNGRTFSIGKVYNVGGRQGNNIGGFHPDFAVHLYCAFNNVGDYADTNLGDLGLSYENIESGLTVEDYLQYFIDALDYSAAYISEQEPGN